MQNNKTVNHLFSSKSKKKQNTCTVALVRCVHMFFSNFFSILIIFCFYERIAHLMPTCQFLCQQYIKYYGGRFNSPICLKIMIRLLYILAINREVSHEMKVWREGVQNIFKGFFWYVLNCQYFFWIITTWLLLSVRCFIGIIFVF